MNKKNFLTSQHSKTDSDQNRNLDNEDIDYAQQMLELELREEKADSQRRMAWVAIISMSLFTVFLFSPLISETRVAALADLLGLFYIAQASVVGAYMGVTAWMSKTISGSPHANKINNIYTAKRVPQHREPEL